MDITVILGARQKSSFAGNDGMPQGYGTFAQASQHVEPVLPSELARPDWAHTLILCVESEPLALARLATQRSDLGHRLQGFHNRGGA